MKSVKERLAELPKDSAYNGLCNRDGDSTVRLMQNGHTIAVVKTEELVKAQATDPVRLKAWIMEKKNANGAMARLYEWFFFPDEELFTPRAELTLP